MKASTTTASRRTIKGIATLFDDTERKQLFRLCHTCSTLNESEEEILRCMSCGKGFLPINYFEKIRARAQQISKDPATSDEMPGAIFSPINGLIVFW